jgi:hypothetical protein
VDLRGRLDDYEVTAVPRVPPALSLVWSEADEPVDDDLLPTFGALALLDDYRITHVPSLVA